MNVFNFLNFIEYLTMETVKKFLAARITIAYDMKLNAPPDKVFPLLCPTREYDWIEPWRCELIFSYSGYAEPDCIFQTDYKSDGGLETWIVARYEPNKLIQFIRTNPIKVIRYTITLTDNEDGTTTANWEQLITGLNKAGNDFVFAYSDEKFIDEMTNLEKMLNYYLETGSMLKMEDINNY